MVEDFIYSKVIPTNLNFITQNFKGAPVKKLGDLYIARKFNPSRNQIYISLNKIYVTLDSLLCIEITDYIKELHKLLYDGYNADLELYIKTTEVLAHLRTSFNSDLDPLSYLINNSKLIYFINSFNFESKPILIVSSEIPKNIDKSVSSTLIYTSKITYNTGFPHLTLNSLTDTDTFKFSIPHFTHYLNSFYLPNTI